MKVIQHEDTGYMSQIADDVPIPRRWFEIKNYEPSKEIPPYIPTGQCQSVYDTVAVLGRQPNKGLKADF